MVFEAILYIAVLIISAKLLGELMHRIKQPTIIGNVLAGIIVGPALFFLVQPIDAIELFISIGVFFLFFLIGLEEIDLPGLVRVMRGRIFAGSLVGFFIPFFVASLFGLSLDMNFIQAFAIGSVIGASSLGVTAKVLTDLGKLRSTIGLEIFTVTAIIEFIAIILTSVLIQINSSDAPNISEFLWLFAKMGIFFSVAGLLAVFALPKVFRIIHSHLRAQQVYFGLVIGGILLVAYFAEISGIHGAIGALLLGIAVSRMNREEYIEISKNVHAIGYGIFIPIFFAGIGLHFTTRFVEIDLWIIATFIAIIVGVKFIGSYLAVKIAKMRPATTVAYGVMSKGAVDLALMLSLLQVNLLDDSMFSLLVLGTLITMIISSVELQRKLKKIVQVKVGSVEIGMLPIFFRRTVSDKRAQDAMTIKFQKTKPDVSVKTFLNSDIDPKEETMVIDDDGRLIGIVSKKELNNVHKKNREVALISDIMERKFHTVIPQDYIYSVIQKMNSHHFEMIPVIEPGISGKIMGIVSSKTLLSLLAETKPVTSTNSKS